VSLMIVYEFWQLAIHNRGFFSDLRFFKNHSSKIWPTFVKLNPRPSPRVEKSGKIQSLYYGFASLWIQSQEKNEDPGENPRTLLYEYVARLDPLPPHPEVIKKYRGIFSVRFPRIFCAYNS
jgi:hypothetical protein